MFTQVSRLTRWASYGDGGCDSSYSCCKIMGKKHIRQKSYCLWKMVLNWVNYIQIMKKRIKTILAFLLLTIISIDSKSQEPQWKMIWNDEFEKNGLPDSNKWGYDVGGHGWGNNELQFYTDKRK